MGVLEVGVYLSKGPKILFLDVETAPDVVWTWGVYEQNAISVKEHWYILSYAAKWKGAATVVRGLDDFGKKQDDARLLSELWDLLNEADIVVAHNGIDFDLKKINARMIVQGMLPPSPYKVIDTKRAVKRVAAFSSNKLDWLCKQLELGHKLEHEGFPMWEGCMTGDKASWKKMKRYNRHDVTLLEKLYNELSPWITQPNGNMWGNCVNPNCKSNHIQSRGIVRNKTRVYQRFVCMKCGTWSRSVLSDKQTKAERVPI